MKHMGTPYHYQPMRRCEHHQVKVRRKENIPVYFKSYNILQHVHFKATVAQNCQTLVFSPKGPNWAPESYPIIQVFDTEVSGTRESTKVFLLVDSLFRCCTMIFPSNLLFTLCCIMWQRDLTPTTVPLRALGVKSRNLFSIKAVYLFKWVPSQDVNSCLIRPLCHIMMKCQCVTTTRTSNNYYNKYYSYNFINCSSMSPNY